MSLNAHPTKGSLTKLLFSLACIFLYFLLHFLHYGSTKTTSFQVPPGTTQNAHLLKRDFNRNLPQVQQGGFAAYRVRELRILPRQRKSGWFNEAHQERAKGKRERNGFPKRTSKAPGGTLSRGTLAAQFLKHIWHLGILQDLLPCRPCMNGTSLV